MKFIRSNEFLKPVLVLIMTTSDSPTDIENCYALNANSYLRKPNSVEGYQKIAEMLRDFWFSLSKLPVIESVK